MSKGKAIVAFTVMVAAIALMLFYGLGCTPAELQRAKEGIQESRAAATQSIADNEAILARLPPDSQQAKDLAKVIAQGKETIAKADVQLARVEALITAAINGNVSDLAAAASSIPAIGGYLSLAISFAGNIFQRFRNKKIGTALTQTVSALNGRLTEEQKTALAMAHDSTSKALVGAIKANLL